MVKENHKNFDAIKTLLDELDKLNIQYIKIEYKMNAIKKSIELLK